VVSTTETCSIYWRNWKRNRYFDGTNYTKFNRLKSVILRVQ